MLIQVKTIQGTVLNTLAVEAPAAKGGTHYQFPNLAYMYTLYSTLTLFTFYIVTHTLNKGLL